MQEQFQSLIGLLKTYPWFLQDYEPSQKLESRLQEEFL